MIILLTGATGFLGYRTLEELIKLKEVKKVLAIGRTLKPTHQVHHHKVEYILGDLCNEKFISGLFNNVTHVIHAAALSSPWGSYQEFYNANVRIQQHLIKESKIAGICKYIFISTPSLYFEFKDKEDISESDPLPKRYVNDYASTKRLAEIELENSELPYVILRPRALIGRGDTVIMPRLIRAYDEGKLKIIGDGKNKVDLSSVANVVQAILLSLNANQKAIGQTYNISNGDPILLWEAIADVLTKLKRKPPRKKLPFMLVKFIARLMENKARWTNGKEPALTKYGVGTLSMTFTMNIDKAKQLLKYRPNVSNQEAITEFVNWYKEYEER